MNTLGFQSQVVGQMLPEDLQETLERTFAKKHLYKYLDTAMESDYSMLITKGEEIVNAWLDAWLIGYKDQCTTESYWQTKTKRLALLKELDIRVLVRDILGCIALDKEPVLLVSIAGQSAARLGWSDRKESLTAVSELIAVLRLTEAFTITRSESDRMVVNSNMKLPSKLTNAIERSRYLPPMVSCPVDLDSNYQSAYRTFNDTLLLGKGNAHDGDICLDVLNTQNQIPMKLALDFLCKVEEEPSVGSDMDDIDKQRNWLQFKVESYQTYSLMQNQGNRFYQPHKVDCRGRMYSQGYHITSQGGPFKKASLEFLNEEIVEGYNPT